MPGIQSIVVSKCGASRETVIWFLVKSIIKEKFDKIQMNSDKKYRFGNFGNLLEKITLRNLTNEFLKTVPEKLFLWQILEYFRNCWFLKIIFAKIQTLEQLHSEEHWLKRIEKVKILQEIFHVPEVKNSFNLLERTFVSNIEFFSNLRGFFRIKTLNIKNFWEQRKKFQIQKMKSGKLIF